jgi:Rho-binding antiterminator
MSLNLGFDKVQQVKAMISCNEHDYIEIVCMQRYPIKLTMKTGEVITGIALDTQFNNNRDECIQVNVGGHNRLFVLTAISSLEVRIKNPHVQRVSFA